MSIQRIKSGVIAEGAALNSVSDGVFFRNRIINGDMRIDQRNAGASVTLGATGYTLDRWNGSEDTSATVTCQQSTDAPAGYTNSALLTTTTAASATASQRCIFSQFIEGFNVADLGFGAAGAKTVTISFWVKSSLTGTYCVAIRNGAGNRSYVAEYAISSANTWEYKTVTIVGDTTGTWLKDSGVGFRVDWDLGSGSDFVATVNTWTAANKFTTASPTNFINNLNATLQLTGVQFEVGSVATPFERRPYGTELALCQRYFQKGQIMNSGNINASAVYSGYSSFPVEMRAAPTMTSGTYTSIGGGGFTDTTVTWTPETYGVRGQQTAGGNTNGGGFVRAYTAAAEL
jgi:hypothetical protein